MRPHIADRAEAEHVLRVSYGVEVAGLAHGLGPDEVLALREIAVAERTWCAVASLVVAGVAAETLAGLETHGWLESFPLAAGPAISLTPWAAEVFGLDQVERWEAVAVVIDQEDSSGEKTRTPLREPTEVPRWDLAPPPREPGQPRPKKVPLQLPRSFSRCHLPEDVVRGLLARTVPTPPEECIAREEWLMEQARTAEGTLDVDPDSGKVREVPVVLFGSRIPREKPRRKVGKKKRRRKATRSRVEPVPA